MSNRDPVCSPRLAVAALAGSIAALAAGAAWAAPSPQAIKPVWVQTPTAKDIMSVYPVDAHNAGAEGMAVIGCKVAADGTLTACAVERQAPAKYRFGEAGLKLASDFRMQPKDKDGRRTAGVAVRIPIRFNLADDALLDAPPRR